VFLKGVAIRDPLGFQGGGVSPPPLARLPGCLALDGWLASTSIWTAAIWAVASPVNALASTASAKINEVPIHIIHGIIEENIIPHFHTVFTLGFFIARKFSFPHRCAG
jgi:hypothetical protein